MGQQFGCFSSPDEYPMFGVGQPVYGPFSKDPDLVPRTKLDEHLDLVEHAALQLRHIVRGLEARRVPK